VMTLYAQSLSSILVGGLGRVGRHCVGWNDVFV
jgi:hypothetical protein